MADKASPGGDAPGRTWPVERPPRKQSRGSRMARSLLYGRAIDSLSPTAKPVKGAKGGERSGSHLASQPTWPTKQALPKRPIKQPIIGLDRKPLVTRPPANTGGFYFARLWTAGRAPVWLTPSPPGDRGPESAVMPGGPPQRADLLNEEQQCDAGAPRRLLFLWSVYPGPSNSLSS